MSPREMRALLAAAAVALVVVPRAAAGPVTSCTTSFGEFIADSDDLCVYYQCVFGSPVLRQCAKSTRVPSYYQISTTNPCTLGVSQSKCLRCDINDTAPAPDLVSTICQDRPFLCAPCGCVNQVKGYWCNCSVTVPTLPPQPSDPVPLCAVNVCLNGGTCNKLFDERPLCLCAPGFTGDLCQSRLCDYNPCLNGGTCVANGTSIHCNCVNCFTGTCCEYPIPNCGAPPVTTPPVTTPIATTPAPTCDPCHYGAGCSQVRTWLCSCSPCPTGQTCSDSTPGNNRACSAGSASDKFTLVFEENHELDSAALEIYATSAVNDGQPRTVRAYAKYGDDPNLNCPFDQTQTIPAGQVYKFNVPTCLRHDGTGPDRKGIRVVEVNGNPITVYAINRATFSADSWLALPDSKASKSFVALTNPGFQIYKSECTIVAIYNNTQVTMYLSVDTDLPTTGSATFVINLDEAETYQVQAVLPGDMSGTVFVSTLPVHITCGVVRAYAAPNPSGPLGPIALPSGLQPSRDALVEEMIGSDYWSTTFAVVPITRQIIGYSYTEVVILIAGYTSTECTVYSTNPTVFPVTVAISGPNFLYRGWYDASADYFINCTYPVLLEELTESAIQGFSQLDDPSLMFVPGVSQYTNFYQFGPPTYSQSNGPYAHVFAKLAARDVDYAAITIGGYVPNALKPWRQLNVPSNPDTANYPSLYGGVFYLSNNTISAILHPTNSVKFMCIIYAFDNRESVGHVGGLSLSATNAGLVFDVVTSFGG